VLYCPLMLSAIGRRIRRTLLDRDARSICTHLTFEGSVRLMYACFQSASLPAVPEAYYSGLMGTRILTIAITGPAFTESRDFAAFTVKAKRSSFHVSPRVFLPTSTSSGCRR
jgi:hypothetical protein